VVGVAVSENAAIAARLAGSQQVSLFPAAANPVRVAPSNKKRTLILQLGSTNDTEGRPDADAVARAARVKTLHDEAVLAGRRVMVMASGGADPAFAFNPTSRPHWSFVSDLLVTIGIPEVSLRPGLPALHTVHEVLMCREHVEELATAGVGVDEVVVVTSDYHAARARHLFSVAFGKHAGLEVSVSIEEVPGQFASHTAREARLYHEHTALEALRMAPYDPWLAFIRAHSLEALNRTDRLSER